MPRSDAIPGYDFSNPPPRKPQWAYSYQRTIRAHEEQLRKEAAFGIELVYELPSGKRRRPADMKRREIQELARRMAEVDLNHAINDWNSTAVAARRAVRTGEAF